MKAVENLAKRKPTGGKRRPYRGRRAYELDRYPIETLVGEQSVVKRRVRGGNYKLGVKRAEYANVLDPKEGRVMKAKILRVLDNPANRDYSRRGVITKGAVLETDVGKARVTSRPGQEGVVNAILL